MLVVNDITMNFLEQAFYVSPLTIVTSIILLFVGTLYVVWKDKGLPPGPVGLPLIGYWPFLKDEAVHLQELTKKYGDVFSFRVAGKLFIHLGSIRAIKEAHVTRSDSFSRRFTDYSILSIAFGKGIITRNGEEWKVLRKFFVQTFREYGLTSLKDYMTGSVYDSVNAIIKTLRDTSGSPINILPILNLRSSAIFRRMMFNYGEITEEELQGLLEAYGSLINLFSGKKVLLIGDFAKKFLFPRIKGFEESLESYKVMQSYLRKIIRRHEETFDGDNIRDVIDSYIKERKHRYNRSDPAAQYFSEDVLVGTLIQFVGDGILTVAIFIAYFIHALLEYPEEQEKIYKELEDVVGVDSGVTLKDKNNLPYTNAFIQEVIRTADVFTYFANLECTNETTLHGYKIPVGAITVTNLWSSHRDPATFDEPDTFKPSRYITEPGKTKTEPPILFGVGKRACTGESYTMMQVFLFLTAIVKNFRLARPEGEVKRSFLDGNMDICAFPRK